MYAVHLTRPDEGKEELLDDNLFEPAQVATTLLSCADLAIPASLHLWRVGLEALSFLESQNVFIFCQNSLNV